MKNRDDLDELKVLINKLYMGENLELEELKALLQREIAERKFNETGELSKYLFEKSSEIRKKHYQNRVYIRGLIEFTNYCKNDCYYCGIRKSNAKVGRYRLTKEEILSCCDMGYPLGFRTFVLQGGEDGWYSDDQMVDIIDGIKNKYPDCAVTLSVGEKNRKSYEKFFNAGADRYLLRHETSDAEHYKKLHPPNMLLETRKKCLTDLREIGFQVGCGIMVGSPFQTIEHLAQDLLFMKEFNPDMVGMGPFLSHHDTPFAGKQNGTVEQTLFLLGLVRLMLPKVLLPATTALGTVNQRGRELGVLVGANVVMPNLSPVTRRKDYQLYDNKICTGDEAAEGCRSLSKSMRDIGYEVVVDRGDVIK